MGIGFSSKYPAITLCGHNKTLELTPGVPFGTDAGISTNRGCCAVVGGAAQLYVMFPKDYQGFIEGSNGKTGTRRCS